jgi:hypothetical protein
MIKAPITKEQRTMLKSRLVDVKKTAADLGDAILSNYEYKTEQAIGKQQFELGCWLFWLSEKVYIHGRKGLPYRALCMALLEEQGIIPGYDFYTVFRFGERHYDTLFEMGDAKDVKDLSKRGSKVITKMLGL